MGSRCLIWKFFGFWFPHRSKPAAIRANLTQKCQAMFAWRLTVCGSKIDHNQSIHQIRAGNLTKFNEYFTISRILIVFLASIAKLCKTEPPKSLPLLLKSSSTENITEGHRRTRRSGNKTELWYLSRRAAWEKCYVDKGACVHWRKP